MMTQYTGVVETSNVGVYTGGTATVGLGASWPGVVQSNSSYTAPRSWAYSSWSHLAVQFSTPFRQEIEQAVQLAAQVEEWAPISPTVVNAATNLIARFVYATGVPWPQNAIPHISSDGEGGIMFEWWKGTRSLTLFARADGGNGMLLAWGPDIREDMESIEEPSDAEMLGYWRRLIRG